MSMMFMSMPGTQATKICKIAGMSEDQIDLIKSDAIENELLEKAALSVDELSKLGYDNIRLLF